MPTANELLLDATVRHQVKLLRFSKGEAQRAVKLLEQSDAELVQLLGKELSASGRTRLEALLKSIRQLRSAVHDELKKRAPERLQSVAETEAEWEKNAVEGTAPFELQLAAVPPATLKAVASSPIQGIKVEGWLDNLKKGDIRRLEQAVRLGVTEGQTVDELIRRVRGTAANNFEDGVLATTRRGAEALVRTSVNHVSNAARQAVWEQNADIVKGLRWTSTLDGRTSPICQSRDGEVYSLTDGPRPPAHFNCRSTMVAVIDGVAAVGDRPFVTDTRRRKDREVDFRDEAKAEAGDAWKGMSKEERQDAIRAKREAWAEANVGTVPARTTYQEWLKRQPAEFQDEVLGKAKGELFRKGTPLDKFVDENGKPTKLSGLRADNKGDALDVVQPGVGLKAKALLQQGMTTEQVLDQLKTEFPDASPTPASIASYKSELKKAGALDALKGKVLGDRAKKVGDNFTVHDVAQDLDGQLPAGLKHAVGGQWLTVAGDLDGAGGAYASYQAGQGVTVSAKKLAGMQAAQAKQVLAHELGHLLHKQHDVVLDGHAFSDMGASASALKADKDAGKLYSYYLSSIDELVAEVYAQALSPSPLTSQGLDASRFKKAFSNQIESAKKALADKFPAPKPADPVPVVQAPSFMGETGGKIGSIGGYAKALLQQGMPDDAVLAAVKAEFPHAKTTKASLASYKVELKKQGLLPAKGTGQVVQATPPKAQVVLPGPVSPATKAGAEVLGAPIPDKASFDTVEEATVALVKAGIVDKDAVAAALKAKYPNSPWTAKQTPSAMLKHVKEKFPADFKAALKQEQPSAVPPGAPKDSPLPAPKLLDKKLGAFSTGVLQSLENGIKAGTYKAYADALGFLKSKFGAGFKAEGGTDLWELAQYNVATGKLTKPAVQAAYTYAPTEPPKARIDMTPARPATTPRDGLPPPPRFTEEQKREAVRLLAPHEELSQSKLSQVNSQQKKAGLPALTESEFLALRSYTGSTYREVNRKLRAGAYKDDLALQAYVEAGQSALAKMPKFSGLTKCGLQASPGPHLEAVLSTYVPGNIVEDASFVSTSNGGGEFSGNVRLSVRSRTGVSVQGLSKFASEAEVLFAPGTRYKVVSLRQERGRYHIEMEEVD